MTVNYFDQEGVLINSDYKRYNIRSNTNFKRGKWNINANLAMQIEDQLSPAWALLMMHTTILLYVLQLILI